MMLDKSSAQGSLSKFHNGAMAEGSVIVTLDYVVGRMYFLRGTICFLPFALDDG
jgi:hypothetical protein